ncbi:MAG: hypothetical protein AABX17_03110, partial [Nanoarchaeota archaeon]
GDMGLRDIAEYSREIKHLHTQEYAALLRRFDSKSGDSNSRRILKSLWWNHALTEFATIIEVTKKRKFCRKKGKTGFS